MAIATTTTTATKVASGSDTTTGLPFICVAPAQVSGLSFLASAHEARWPPEPGYLMRRPKLGALLCHRSRASMRVGKQSQWQQKKSRQTEEQRQPPCVHYRAHERYLSDGGKLAR